MDKVALNIIHGEKKTPTGLYKIDEILCSQENLNRFSREESIKDTFSEIKNERELMIIYQKN